MLPDFVGIGAQRAATTWVHACLKEHPQVFVPDIKEIHYFDANLKQGVDWYESFFETVRGQKAVGEITPNYLNVRSAVPALAELLPTARLFAILRDPVDRAYSAYKLMWETFRGMSFQEACESSDYLLGLSRYGEQLEWVYKFYSRERVKILLYDDLIANPQGFLSDLYSYLDVDPDFRPASITKIYNRIVLPETQKRIGRLGLGWLVQRVKNTAVGSMLKNCLNYTRRHHNDDYVRQLRAYFHNDVRQLETMIGRDLSSWICP